MFKYNPNDTTVTLDGVFITGMGEDMIEFSFDEERFETVVGAQGDVVVNETNNNTASMTMTLQVSSPQYAMCLNYAKNGTVFPIWGVNKSVGERFGGTKARFKNTAGANYGTSAEDRSFEIQVFDGVHEPC